MRAILLAIGLAAALAVPCRAQSPAPSASPEIAPTLSPNQIFAAGFRRLAAYPAAPYIVWDDVWRIRLGELIHSGETPDLPNTEGIDYHRYAVRLSDEAELASPAADKDGTLPPALVLHEFIGPFAWSLRSNVVKPPSNGTSMHPDVAEALKVIASVTAVAKLSYDVTLVRIENVDGHDCYHLRLRPIGDPQVHNLRDLWWDVKSFDLWKAHYVGTYTPDGVAPASPSDVTTYFTPIGIYWVASRSVWTYDRIDLGVRTTFDVLTANMAFPASLPDWLFDQNAYDQHVKAKDPDVLGPILAGH